MRLFIRHCGIVLTIMLCLLAITPLTVRADVVIGPRNDFYERNQQYLVYTYRYYYANGSIGYVSVKVEPGSGLEVQKIMNGEQVYIRQTYDLEGSLWGYVEIEAEDRSYREWTTGWIRMENLVVIYDSVSFEEDNDSRIYEYNGEFDSLYDVDEIVIWTWPGSGEIISIFEGEEKDRFIETIIYFREGPVGVGFSGYLDKEGREWTALRTLAARSWICLSDPANSEIAAFNPAPQSSLIPADDTARASGFGRFGIPPLLLITILVIVVVAGSAVLIKVFWKPNKNGQR